MAAVHVDPVCQVSRAKHAAGPLPIGQRRFPARRQVDGDVDLRQLEGQRQLDVLCRFMRAIGRRLGKPVVMLAGKGGALPG